MNTSVFGERRQRKKLEARFIKQVHYTDLLDFTGKPM